MARNGSGTYNLPQSAFVYDTVIDETKVNSNFSDIADALTASISKDGQTTPTANLPMGGFKLTGLADGSARTDSAALGQIQGGSGIWCGTAGGTANAITLTPAPAITAYAAGQRFEFKSGASANIGAVTFAISGLGTIAGQVNGSACSGGEIAANQWYRVTITDTSTAQIERVGKDTSSAVGDMIGANNLAVGAGGVANAATARTNLGLGTVATLAVDTDTTLAANSDSNVATQKATKAYADLKAALASVNAFTKAQRGTPVVLTDAATVAVDASLGNNFEVKLGGNRTLGVPTSIAAGQSGSFQVYQDSTGSRTLAYSWCYGFAGGTAPTLTTTALGRDKLSYDVVRGQSATVTITIATPGVVTYTGHGLQTGDWVQITTTGALPTGLTASTTYWVVYVDANSFSLATTKANAAAGTKIATSGSQSGTHTLSCINIDIAAAKDFR